MRESRQTFRQSCHRTALEYPCQAQIHSLVEALIDTYSDIVAPVVFVREQPALIATAVFKQTVSLGERIAQPSRCIPDLFFNEKFRPLRIRFSARDQILHIVSHGVKRT